MAKTQKPVRSRRTRRTRQEQEEDKCERDPVTGEAIGEKPKYRDKPGLHRGKGAYSAGEGGNYILHTDGSYELNPGDRLQFNQIESEIVAINKLVNSVVDHARTRYAVLVEERRKWFSRVVNMVYQEENEGNVASYFQNTGRLVFKPTSPGTPDTLGTPGTPGS